MKSTIISISTLFILAILGVNTNKKVEQKSIYNYDNLAFAENYLDSLKKENKVKYIGSLKKVDSLKVVVKVKDKKIVHLTNENNTLKDTLFILKHDTIKKKTWFNKLFNK